MRALALDLLTGDLLRTGGRLAVVEGVDAIAQQIDAGIGNPTRHPPRNGFARVDRTHLRALPAPANVGTSARDAALVIPESFAGRITFPTAELVGAVRAVAPKGANSVSLALQRDVGHVVLRVDDYDGNAAETQVAATFVGELPAAIGFNGQYLRELLDALSDEDRTVTFEVNGEVDPVRVDGAGRVTAVMMPMRV